MVLPVDPSHGKYLVQIFVSEDMKEVPHEDLLDCAPTSDPSPLDNKLLFIHIPWIVHEARCTLFLQKK